MDASGREPVGSTMIIDLGKPIIDDQLGDVTQEVIAELIKMNKLGTPVELEERQARLAKQLGMEAREFAGGHSVAQIDPEIFMRWVARDGLQEALNGRVDWARKRFPETNMTYRPEKTRLHVNRTSSSTLGRRGRWACAVPCAS